MLLINRCHITGNEKFHQKPGDNGEHVAHPQQRHVQLIAATRLLRKPPPAHQNTNQTASEHGPFKEGSTQGEKGDQTKSRRCNEHFACDAIQVAVRATK